MKSLVVIIREAVRMFSKKPSPPTPRQPGMFAGQIKIKPGFDEIPEGFKEAFE